MMPRRTNIPTYEPLISVRVYAGCPMCDGRGESGSMMSTEEGYSNNLGAFWAHRCNLCDFEEEYDRNYPDVEHLTLTEFAERQNENTTKANDK